MTSPKHAEVSDPSINVDQLIHQIKNKDITHHDLLQLTHDINISKEDFDIIMNETFYMLLGDDNEEGQDPSVPSRWICRLPVEPILRSLEYKWKKRLLSEISGLIKNMHAKE